ncbi:MAG: hypothetical protein A4E57_04560 [Syntrophorhabdaceae bacterium PtaU1.Bin034]|nr:MAG: hypothetical protein A4E57_04560 [Syntrophorhabdaceae bacterium PtaU1.Bin034]
MTGTDECQGAEKRSEQENIELFLPALPSLEVVKGKDGHAKPCCQNQRAVKDAKAVDNKEQAYLAGDSGRNQEQGCKGDHYSQQGETGGQEMVPFQGKDNGQKDCCCRDDNEREQGDQV